MTMKTPHGDECIVPTPAIAGIILSETRGSYQRDAACLFIKRGWMVLYQADGAKVKGKAGKYSGRYQRSIRNMMDRIMDALPAGVSIISGSVGPKGAFGYYLSD